MTEENISEQDQKASKTSQTKVKKNQTDNVKWSIFTAAETKVAVGKASKKTGRKLNEYVDEKLMTAAMADLTAKAEPPARTEDLVNDILNRYTERMRAEQAETIKAQNQLIQQQGEQLKQLTDAIKQQPVSLGELIFGKPKKK